MTDALRLDKLRDLGLGPSASRAYLALLEAGRADARTIGRVARIPLPKVYGTMEVLMEKGFARQILATPKQFEPITIPEYLEEHRKTLLEEAERLDREAAGLSALFRVPRKAAASDRGAFSVIRGRRSAIQKHRALAEGATRSLLFLWSDGVSKRLGDARLVLEQAHARGLDIDVLVPRTATASPEVRAMAALANVRVNGLESQSGSVAYAVFDDAEALVTHFVPDDGSLADGHDVALHVTESAIVGSLTTLIRAHWREAKRFPGKRPSRKAP